MPNLITVTEAVARAGVTKARIYALLVDKRIVGTKHQPKTWLIDADSLQRWIDDPAQHKRGNPNFKTKEGAR